MLIDILSLFPEYFQGPFEVSILKRAIEKRIIEVRHTNIRDFAEGKHRKVDDRPFGGGPGMVLMPKPLTKAIRSRKEEKSYVIYLTPQGKKLTANTCERLALIPHLILVCGHYEGIDQRVIDSEIDEEISIGDYVLTNGCLPAIVLVDAVVRFIPGVLGHEEAAQQDSFQKGVFDAPQYTTPRDFEGECVPEVLLGGNHALIKKWREEEAIKNTRRVRPELFKEQL
jgi:tRNA (guanine37-N1)-methyltransferase